MVHEWGELTSPPSIVSRLGIARRYGDGSVNVTRLSGA